MTKNKSNMQFAIWNDSSFTSLIKTDCFINAQIYHHHWSGIIHYHESKEKVGG